MLGCVLGGKRARTLTAMKAIDVVFHISERDVMDRSTPLRVVEVDVVFRKEKVDDIQGPRCLRDVLPSWLVKDEEKESFGCWVYKLFWLRSMFDVVDPLSSGNVGDTFSVRAACAEYYVFCDIMDVCWIDTVPCTTAVISGWTKRSLRLMGNAERGYSAHRSGFATRSLSIAAYKEAGGKLDPGHLHLVTRACGWTAVTGQQTLLRVYARHVVDHAINTHGLGLGKFEGKFHEGGRWRELEQEILGRILRPRILVRNVGSMNLEVLRE